MSVPALLLASIIACLSDPAPLSSVLITVNVAQTCLVSRDSINSRRRAEDRARVGMERREADLRARLEDELEMTLVRKVLRRDMRCVPCVLVGRRHFVRNAGEYQPEAQASESSHVTRLRFGLVLRTGFGPPVTSKPPPNPPCPSDLAATRATRTDISDSATLRLCVTTFSYTDWIHTEAQSHRVSGTHWLHLILSTATSFSTCLRSRPI